nr:hypothetical protein [uncultured Psychroserpens sp.]
MQNTNNIPQILETIESFQIVKCDMFHEKVVVDVNERPIHRFQDDTIVFDRVKLCDIKHRNKRLGCAHSSVNIKFERVLEDLALALPECINQISELKNEFQSVVAEIYALDHKVGNLEHELAVCQLKSDTKEKDSIIVSMSLLKTEHRSFMTHLSKIKSDIEELIKDKCSNKNL